MGREFYLTVLYCNINKQLLVNYLYSIIIYWSKKNLNTFANESISPVVSILTRTSTTTRILNTYQLQANKGHICFNHSHWTKFIKYHISIKVFSKDDDYSTNNSYVSHDDHQQFGVIFN